MSRNEHLMLTTEPSPIDEGATQSEASSPPAGLTSPLQPPEEPGAALLRAAGQHPDQRKARKRAIEHGEDLLRRATQARIQFAVTPWNMASGIILDELTVHVERWATDAGISEQVPERDDARPTGADFARLKVYVEAQLAALRAGQELR